MDLARPLVGITTDLVEQGGSLRAQSHMTCANSVQQAGGLPVFLPPLPELLREALNRCDAIILTGGDDPRTEPFGEPTHPKTTPVHPQRQSFESALLTFLGDHAPDLPVLGICLGMQMMALQAGGRLNQHLPDTNPNADRHWDHEHPVTPDQAIDQCILPAGRIWSRHRQAIDDPGSLAILSRADDRVIEAVADPTRAFYLGVQWHPERSRNPALGQSLFDQLIEAARLRIGSASRVSASP